MQRGRGRGAGRSVRCGVTDRVHKGAHAIQACPLAMRGHLGKLELQQVNGGLTMRGRVSRVL